MVRTFKFIQTLVLLGSLLTVSLLGVSASAHQSYSVPARGGGDGGGSHPWPWGLELPFPWEGMQGIWKVENKGKVFYFSFRRVGEKRLFVTQFDASRCVVLGTGPGLIRNKSQNYLVAQVTVKPSGDIYRMAVYAFAEEDSPEPPAVVDGDTIPERVMVARITSMNSASREIAVQMVRISDRLEYKCLGQDKKLKF